MGKLSPVTVACWRLFLSAPHFANGKSYRQTTAASVVYEGRESTPVEATELDELSSSNLSGGLDWMLLAKQALPNAVPLTPDERASINEFFWSHFQ